MRIEKAGRKFFLITIFVFFGFAAFAALAMSDTGDSGTWRYKMTVTVETPEGIKTGSAVREMSNSPKTSGLRDVGNPADVKGEAVAVDLGERGVLFALISHQSDLEFYNAFPIPGHGGSTPEAIKHYASLPVGTKGILNPKAPPGYPKLVAFTDMNDPKSVVQAQEWTYVFGKERGQNFEITKDRMKELFGHGVKLKDITLEITDEPVTWGAVDKLLPWLEKVGGGYLHGGFTSKDSPLGLDGGNFRRGTK